MDIPVNRVLRLINSYRFSQAVSVATRLGIPDELASGGKTADQLAELVSVKSGPLYQVLRASASCGVFVEDENGRFSNTPMSDCLRCDVQGPARIMALLLGHVHFAAFDKLMQAVQSGKPAFELAFGAPFFEYIGQRDELGRMFDSLMTKLFPAEVDAVINAYDFGSAGRILDVGAGRGTVTRALMARFPHLRCGLFDQPATAERTRKEFATDGIIDRCTIEMGSFFEAVPPGYDSYLLKHVLHDWTDEKCMMILRNVRKAAGHDSRLLLLEYVVPPGNQPSLAKEFDLLMLATFAGKERSESEFQELLAKSGFRLNRVVRSAMELNVIEALPV
jgi:O-methyltransferase domain/Dimerisation domain